MVIKEFYRVREDGVRLVRSFSDVGKKIRKVGTEEIYDEAIDIEESAYEYEETEEDADVEEVPDDEAIRILMGGEENEG